MCKGNNVSKAEQEIVDYIKSIYDGDIIQNTRNVIKPLELDIYLPQAKVAIEYDGLFWHSNIYVDKNYHLEKTTQCEAKGIKLFHIFENEWIDKKDIWKSVIANALGKSKRIYARKTQIKEISGSESKAFFDNNHLQGSSAGNKVSIGLFYNDEIVCAISFCKPRYNKNYEWEILRLCNKVNHNVIGGASKLLKYFKDKYQPQSILSYGNRRWCNLHSNIYKSLGFELLGMSNPAYYYFQPQKTIIYNRVLFQKHKLKDKLKIFSENKTEMENMYDNGYLTIFDCGNLCYNVKK